MPETRCFAFIPITRAVILLALATAPATAIVEPRGVELEVPLGSHSAARRPVERDPYRLATPRTRAAALDVVTALERRLGGTWRVSAWNPFTRTPHLVLGSGVETGVTIRSDADAEALARRWMANHPEVFHEPSRTELVLDDVRHARGKIAVHFRQTHRGVGIEGARAHLTFTSSGRLFVMHSSLHADVRVSTDPGILAERATAIARSELVAAGARLAATPSSPEPMLIIVPVPDPSGGAEHRLAWRTRTRTERPVGRYRSDIDAHDGTLLQRTNEILHLGNGSAAIEGDVTADVERITYCEPSQVTPLGHALVQAIGVDSTWTDAGGHFTFANGGARGVAANLRGPYCIVNRLDGANAEAVAQGDIGPSYDMHFDDTYSRRDERNAFDAVNAVHDLVETFDPGFVFTNTPVVVNLGHDDTCNAFWDGTITCFRAGDGCANTGEIQSIVQHELGHGLQDALVGGQGEQGLGEGNADVLANLMTGESLIGRGFWQDACDTGIRDSDNLLAYPGDVVGRSTHQAGRVIAAFHWDVFEALVAELGAQEGREEAASLWHAARKLERPWTQPDQVLATFIADDDNGNLFDGSPNCAVLNDAAFTHGFATQPCAVVVVHYPLSTQTTAGDVNVAAFVFSTQAAISDVTLTYRLNENAALDVEMTNPDGTGVYRAVIPALEPMDEVTYHLTASDAAGNTVTEPFGVGSGESFQFAIATYFHDMEQDTGWRVNAEGLDDALTGAWERVDPIPTSVQPDDDHTGSGVRCWVTGQHPITSTYNGANDVDLGTTRLSSPAWDLSGHSGAKLQYWRFYSNNSGSDPGNDLWLVELRNDGGPWQSVEKTYDSSNAWILVEDDLSERFGEQLGVIELRFSATDLDPPSLVEAAVDDVAIISRRRVVAADPVVNAPAVPYLAAPRPNPSSATTTFRFGLERAADARLELFDVTGRHVRTLLAGRLEAGHHRVSWEGTGAGGSKVAPGVYFARLTSGATSRIERVIRIL